MQAHRTNLSAMLSSNWRKLVSGIVIATTLIGSTVAMAQEAVNVEKRRLGSNGRIEVLGDVFAGLPMLAGQQMRMVVYHRPGTTRFVGAATVFINDTYHASLVPGGYSQLCMAPGAAQVNVREIHVGGQPKDSIDNTLNLTMASGQTQFMQVQEDAGRAVLKLVERAQALQDLAGLRLQQHTISRVEKAQTCEVLANGATESALAMAVPAVSGKAVASKVEVATPAVKTEQVLLAGDALFAFGKSDIQNLMPAGIASLDELVKRIQHQYSAVQEIQVIGHADPFGAPALNERLAHERANTVSEFLRKQVPMQGARVKAEGRGAREPKVLCATERSPESIACNQANRRVQINITGISR
jgi:OmpA-OmpF porin, OOP family